MLQSLRILLVSDRSGVREHVRAELQRVFSFVALVEPASPAELAEALADGSFDVAVLDAGLAWDDADADAVQARLQREHPAVPVIVVGALPDAGVEPDGWLAAAVGIAAARAEGQREVAALQAERAALADQMHAALLAAEDAQHRTALLADAGFALSASLDYEKTLRDLAELCVPALAEWCSVDVVEDGKIMRMAGQHADLQQAQSARLMNELYSHDPDAALGIPAVIRSGKSQLYSSVSEAQLATVARDARHLEMLKSVGFTSVMLVPLLARGRTLGALTLITLESARHYDAADLQLAEELARRAALAIDNARLYRDVQLAVRTRDQFLSVASHELKTPLTTLSGYVELLQRRLSDTSEADPKLVQASQAIGTQYRRLQSLVVELLSVAHLQEALSQSVSRPVDVVAIARRALDTVIPTTERHTLTLVAPDGPLLVQGDERHLEQVLMNLVHNAVKYSPDGGPVEVRVTDGDGKVRITVRDTGIGIPENARAQLFQRFFRAENALAHHISGFGIGLYLVKAVIERMGGSIHVASVENEGSTFRITLARAEPNGEGER